MGVRCVKRFNYHPTLIERVVGRKPNIAVDGPLRLGIGAITAAAALCVAVALVEANRLAHADSELAALQLQIDAAQRVGAHVAELDRDVARLRAIKRALTDVTRASVTSTNDIARLGNSLAQETWLTRVQSTRVGGWSIAGRSPRVDHIGATLSAIASLDPAAETQLVSIEATGTSGNLLEFLIAWNRVL
jgi:hypothetical protein